MDIAVEILQLCTALDRNQPFSPPAGPLHHEPLVTITIPSLFSGSIYIGRPNIPLTSVSTYRRLFTWPSLLPQCDSLQCS